MGPGMGFILGLIPPQEHDHSLGPENLMAGAMAIFDGLQRISFFLQEDALLYYLRLLTCDGAPKAC